MYLQRFFADAGPMLDRMHAAFDGNRDAGIAVGVSRDLALELRRLVDDGLHLIEVELRDIPDVAVREHAAGGENLDDDRRAA